MNPEIEVISEITDIETIAVGRSIRELDRLQRMYGRGRWRKLKGIATVRLPDDTTSCRDTLVRGTWHWQERSQGQTYSRNITMATSKASPQFVVCINNEGYQASLEPRKIYQVLPDKEAENHKMLRVIDESGEDYLFPADYFSPISLPQSLIKELALVV